jgi:predicted TIM-barrel fold metal-dependent hydrolase
VDDPGLPIKLEPQQQCSNGEVAPARSTPLLSEALRRARQMCDENARRLGMSRREFLVSSMGAATTLLAIAACSSESDNANGGAGPGGTYDLPDEAMVDADAALDALGSDQPLMDVQTHLLEYPEGFPAGGGIGMLFPFAAECGDDNPDACFSIERWTEELFERSDTTVAVLSALSSLGEPDPLSAEVMARARDAVDALCGDDRVLVQGHAYPNVGRLEAALEAMREEADRYDICAWKTYTHIGGERGYRLTDDIGEALLAEVEQTGPSILCVHKGLVTGAGGAIGDPVLASPADIGPAAAAHPDVTLVVYHSGAEMEVVEKAYDPAGGGIDRLVKSLEDASIEPGGNVYAELGWTWRAKMGDPDQAAHLLGKLLLAVGEDRLLWGTDSIWAGSPQDQIQAFRAFQITEQFQERYGYPALTDEIKHKILWRNAARLYDVSVHRQPCSPSESEGQRRELGMRRGNVTYGPRTAQAARRLFAAEHPWLLRGR